MVRQYCSQIFAKPYGLIFLTFAGIALALFVRLPSAGADNILSQKWQLVVDSYIKIAFSNGKRQQLNKFDQLNPISLEINCGMAKSSDCDVMKKLISQSVETNMNVSFVFAPNPEMRIEFFDPQNTKIVEGLAEQEFAGGMSDVSDTECMAFVAKNGNAFVKSKVLISSLQPNLKLRSCISEQVARALGLGSVDDNDFATLWSRGLNAFTEKDVWRLRVSNGILEYVHQCPELHSGMSADEVRKKLEMKSSCISRLGGIN